MEPVLTARYTRWKVSRIATGKDALGCSSLRGMAISRDLGIGFGLELGTVGGIVACCRWFACRADVRPVFVLNAAIFECRKPASCCHFRLEAAIRRGRNSAASFWLSCGPAGEDSRRLQSNLSRPCTKMSKRLDYHMSSQPVLSAGAMPSSAADRHGWPGIAIGVLGYGGCGCRHRPAGVGDIFRWRVMLGGLVAVVTQRECTSSGIGPLGN